MDYFTELLESYSKLKKRSLRLLEAEKQKAANKKKKAQKKPATTAEEKPKEKSVSRADAMVMAKSSPTGPPIGNMQGTVMDSKGKPKTLKGYTNSDGDIMAANVGKEGQVAMIIDRKGNVVVTNGVDKFEAWYEKNFAGVEPEGPLDPDDDVQTESESRPGRQFEAAGLYDDDLNANIAEILNRVVQMATTFREIYGDWVTPSKKGEDDEDYDPVGEPKESPEEGPGYGPWLNPSQTENYVTGKSPQSIERKIAEGTIAVWSATEGLSYQDLAASDNLELLKGATFSMNQFLAFGTNDVADMNKNSRCRQLDFQVRKKGNMYIFHSFGDLQEGVVMGESDLFSAAEDMVRKKCGGDIAQVPRGTLEGDMTAQELADYRGTGLEVTFAGAAFYGQIDSMGLSSAKKAQIRKRVGSYIRQKLLKDQEKFVQANKWARHLVESGVATDMDSEWVKEAILDLSTTLTPAGLESFFSTAFALEEVVTDAIKPQMSIPVGKQTGAGYKDDLKYVYFDHPTEDTPAAERAQQAVDHLGLIGKKVNPIQTMTVGELKTLNPELVEIYQDAYNLSDSDTVLAVGASVKSYHDDNPTKAGEIKNYWRRSRLVQGLVTKDVAPGFEVETQRRLGFDAADMIDVRDYQKNVLDATYKTLDSILPDKLTAQMSQNGSVQRINFETVRPLIEARIGKLAEGSKIRAHIIAMFGGENNRVNLQDDTARSEFKEQLNRYMINAQQASDSQQREVSGPNKGKLTSTARSARKNLAYTIQMTGGVMHDSALNKKILNENRTMVGSHQKPINISTQGLVNFDADDAAVDDYNKLSDEDKKNAHPSSDWGVHLDSQGSTIKVKKRNTKQSISLGTKRKKRDDGTRSTNTSVFVSKELGHEGTVIDEQLGKVDDSLLVTFLKGQAQLLEKLLVNE